MPSPVYILCAGGTIDTEYSGVAGTYRVGPPAAPDILRRARVEGCEIRPLLQKDSSHITDAEREKIADAVLSLPEGAAAVLTHGTDTMAETARAIAARRPRATVVLAGAFLPASARGSDAEFNLGFALGAARALPRGVYVAMNGEIFPAGRVRKNREAGRFERTD